MGTGLLLARRVLQKFNLDGVYEGNKNIDGELFCVEDTDDGPGAFRCCLDVGLARTSTGAKLGITPDSVEEMYKKCHAAIRADPAHAKKAPGSVVKKRWNAKKQGLEARKAKIVASKEAFLAQVEDMKE